MTSAHIFGRSNKERVPIGRVEIRVSSNGSTDYGIIMKTKENLLPLLLEALDGIGPVLGRRIILRAENTDDLILQIGQERRIMESGGEGIGISVASRATYLFKQPGNRISFFKVKFSPKTGETIRHLPINQAPRAIRDLIK